MQWNIIVEDLSVIEWLAFFCISLIEFDFDDAEHVW